MGRPRGLIVVVSLGFLPCLAYIAHLQLELEARLLELKTIQRALDKIQGLKERAPDNPEWVNIQRMIEEQKGSVETADDRIELLQKNWSDYLAIHTPQAWVSSSTKDIKEAEAFDCWEPKNMVIKRSELFNESFDYIEKGRLALRECGFVYLDEIFTREKVKAFKTEFNRFKSTEEANSFRYPCQGQGRIEHMVPFKPPFNDTSIYGDKRLVNIIKGFLDSKVSQPLCSLYFFHSKVLLLWTAEEQL